MNDRVDIHINGIPDIRPGGSSIFTDEKSTHLRRHIESLGIFGVNGDATHVGLNHGNRVGPVSIFGQLSNPSDFRPGLTSVLTLPEGRWLSPHV
jgi:hypothetical protein